MVDIVIVNWNSGAYLAKCVNSVLRTEPAGLISSIFVIDNDSDDFVPGDIPKDDRVKILRNQKNLGFAKASNQGFRQCTAPFVLLLNPDAMLLPETMAQCLHYMEQHQETAILGCCLLDDNGMRSKSCSRFPSPLRIFFDAAGLSKIAPHIFKPATIMTDWDHLQSRNVDMVMGAFMFMRRALFEEIGYFDERFFVYYEEVDFSKRLSESGGKIFYDAAITATHSGEGTTKAVKAFRLFLSLKSRLQYARKHFNIAGYILVWLTTWFIEPFARVLYLLFTGNGREIKQVIRGFLLLIKNPTL
jgi:hypothetical protein